MEYSSDNFCCFFIDNPLIFIVLVFDISIGRATSCMLSAFAFGFECELDFPLGISRIPLVYNVSKWSKIIAFVKAIYIVVNGNEPYSLLS